MPSRGDKKSNVINIATGFPIDLRRKFLIAHGAPVVPVDFRQPVHTKEELLTLAAEKEKDFLREMQGIAKEFNLRLVNPGIKSEKRLAEKASSEKYGDVSRVFDPLRVAFVADNTSKIERITSFLTPAENSRVLSLADQFAIPDKESGMRRLKAVYQMPGILTEIQVWHTKMLGAFEESHKPFEKQRGILAALMSSACKLSYGSCGRMQREEKLLAEMRREIHDNAAKAAGLDKLVQHRTFGYIGRLPFVAIERQGDKFETILRPDVSSGKYVIDNALLPAYWAGKFEKTSREQFIMASYALLENHRQETLPRAARRTMIEFFDKNLG